MTSIDDDNSIIFMIFFLTCFSHHFVMGQPLITKFQISNFQHGTIQSHIVALAFRWVTLENLIVGFIID